MPGKDWSMAAPPNSLPPQANDSPLLNKDGILGVQSITATALFYTRADVVPSNPRPLRTEGEEKNVVI
jgi:hypothetical protein